MREAEKEELAKAEAIKASDARNAEWLKKQHEIKEQEYAKLFDDAEKIKEENTNTPQNYEQFNAEMRAYLRDNGLMPFVSKKLDGNMPGVYEPTGSFVKDSLNKIKTAFNKFKVNTYLQRRKQQIIKKRISKGSFDENTAVTAPLLVYPQEVQKNLHISRYADMSNWSEKRWNGAKMTRKEFMENRGKYILQDLNSSKD